MLPEMCTMEKCNFLEPIIILRVFTSVLNGGKMHYVLIPIQTMFTY